VTSNKTQVIPRVNSKNIFNPFAYSLLYWGLEIHNLSIGMTTKQTPTDKTNYIRRWWSKFKETCSL